MAWSDAARAAALEVRRLRAQGKPWKRQRLRVHVAMSDPVQVGGTQRHNKVLKHLNLRARTTEEASEKAMKFYRKRGYKNLTILGFEKQSPRSILK
jgi:hypothetical protein